MVLASEPRTRARRAREKVSWESAQGAAGSGCRSPRPPEPRGAFGPAREPSTARSEMHQKRVGHPATTAIGSRPEGFKKNGIGSTLPHTTIRTPTRDRFILYPHPPPPRPREARAVFVGAQPPTAEPEPPRTLYVEGASRVGCMYRFEDAIFKTGRTVGTLRSSDLHRAGRGRGRGDPASGPASRSPPAPIPTWSLMFCRASLPEARRISTFRLDSTDGSPPARRPCREYGGCGSGPKWATSRC